MFSASGWPLDLAYFTWLACALFASYVIGRRTTWAAGLLAFWTAYSALRIFAVPTSPYAYMTPEWNAGLSCGAASALALIALAFFVAKHLRPWAWQALAAINGAWLLFGGQGVAGNDSMSGCFEACLLPLCFDDPLLSMVAVGACLAARKSQPIALLFVVATLMLLRRKRFKTTASAALAFFGVGTLICKHALFNSDGRTELWKISYDFFRDHANVWAGMGVGTFYEIGPFLTAAKNHGVFVTLHSDWLQQIFEQGIIGVVVAAIVFAQALFVVRKNERLFIALFCYGLFALANFPLHTPFTALFGAYLITLAFAKAQEEKSTHRRRFQA